VKGHASTGSPRQLARKPGVARRPGSNAAQIQVGVPPGFTIHVNDAGRPSFPNLYSDHGGSGGVPPSEFGSIHWT
jgi:hypothetical protein